MIQTNNLIESFIRSINIGNAKAINLQPGQVVQGKVIELLGNGQAFVSVQGSKLLARLEVPLSKDQKSWFLVTSVSKEIRLKLMAENGTTDRANSSTQKLFEHLNLKNTETNRQLISEMLKYNLPLEKGLVESISKSLSQNMDVKEVIPVVKVLAEKKIPINLSNIRSLQEFFKDDSLVNKLNDLGQAIEKLFTSIKGNATIPKDLTNLLQKVQQQSVQLNEEFNYLNKDSNTVKESSKINSNLTQQKIEVPKVESNKILPQITKFLEQIQVKTAAQVINEQNPSLKENLEQLMLKKDALPRDIATNLEKAFHHIAGQHLILAPDASVFTQTILQIPGFFPFSEKPVFVQVHTKKKDGKQIDPDDMRLVFLFQLDHLGDVMTKMHVLQKQIFIQVLNNNPVTKEIIKSLEPSFLEFVNNNGFQTSGITVKPMEKKQANNISSLSSSNTYKGVDIRV